MRRAGILVAMMGVIGVIGCSGVIGVIGCSGGAPAAHGTDPAVGVAATVGVDAGSEMVAAPVTVRECDELIAHVVALAGGGSGSGSASGSAALTAAELETVAAGLRADLGVRCAALPRVAFRCASAAGSLAEVAGCER